MAATLVNDIVHDSLNYWAQQVLAFESEVSNEEDSHRRSSRESDVHREIVRLLVSCLDYRQQG